jgi:SAM-dependent methyltransferase
MLLGTIYRRAIKVLPRASVRWVERLRGRQYPIPIGAVQFGDLRRLSPISQYFGSDRGQPVDRYYIENFLARNAADISGRVLEAGDDSYTLRFGATRVEQCDVVCVEATNPRATIVGDLVKSDTLPEAVFDCIILTQALQYIFDLRAAVATLHRALKPGGILLVTAPGISQSDHGPWTWYWTFTAPALRRLFEDQFGQDAVIVEAHGNVFAATAFLNGVATEELNVSDLDVDDINYPIIVAARAIKRKD